MLQLYLAKKIPITQNYSYEQFVFLSSFSTRNAFAGESTLFTLICFLAYNIFYNSLLPDFFLSYSLLVTSFSFYTSLTESGFSGTHCLCIFSLLVLLAPLRFTLKVHLLDSLTLATGRIPSLFCATALLEMVFG